MNDRIGQLREHIQELNDAGVRRTLFPRLVAESLKKTEGEPIAIRRARAFANVLDRAPHVALPHELLAGSILGIWPLAEGLPSYEQRRDEAIKSLEDYREWKRKASDVELDRSMRWALMARDHYNASVTFAGLQRLIAEMQEHFAEAEDLPNPEIARHLERQFNFDYGEDQRLMSELPWEVANHLDLNYPKVVCLGLSGIRDQGRKCAARTDDPDRQLFYQSAEIAADAALRFVRRYAETLEDASDGPGVTPPRIQELREMATVCRKIAISAPETFREAIQLVWLVHVMSNITGGSAMSFARFDQYMIPFYRRDMENGSLTREEAKTLISCLWLKVNEPKMRTVQSMCLAGMTPAGKDGANELSSLCMEVCAELGQPYPNLSVRFWAGSPEWLYNKAIETIKAGIGHPMVLNDERWIAAFERLGYATEDARDYYNMGCVEMMVQGKLPNWGWLPGGGGVEFPGILEMTFRNGGPNMAGQMGVRTGELESFKTFDQFLEACFTQIRHRIETEALEADAKAETRRRRCFDPYASLFIDDCIEKGLDIFQGGPRYESIRPIGGQGLGTLADSLAAIRKFVFEEKKLTLRELADALDSDFEGHPELRAMLKRKTPRYGNDLDEVDALASQVFAVYADAVHGLNDGTRPGRYVTSVFSYNHHVYGGEVAAATPDGRRRSEPFSDSVGPTQGEDVGGPTSLVSSITKLDHTKVTGAYSMNLKLTPSLVSGATGAEALKALIKTYFERGGVQMQVNFIDQDTLRDAQKHPERHRNVIVRVAGYSEYFHNLDRQLQDEIIRRTGHGV